MGFNSGFKGLTAIGDILFLRDLGGGVRISMTLLPESQQSSDRPSDKSVLQIKAMECSKVVVSGKDHGNLINKTLMLKSVILKEILLFFYARELISIF